MFTTPAVCRTVVVLGYLIAMALVGRPAWAAAGAGLGLVLVWLAPLVLAHQRRRDEEPADRRALAMQPGEARLT